MVACLLVVYADRFPIYLSRLHRLLRGDPIGQGSLARSCLWAECSLLPCTPSATLALPAYWIKARVVRSPHDQGLSYALYLVTFALDSVGDLFGSLFAFAAGLLVLERRVLPRWLGWVSVLAGILLFVRAFTLGGVIATFGVVVDIIGFVLLLIFVLATSVI